MDQALDAERAAFENEIAKRWPYQSTRRSPFGVRVPKGAYVDARTRQDWALWQAARGTPTAPVQIPEPDFYGFRNDDECRVDMCFSPSAPRYDGTFATAYYAAPKLHQLLASATKT